jgi:hypothetical protein
MMCNKVSILLHFIKEFYFHLAGLMLLVKWTDSGKGCMISVLDVTENSAA